MADDDRKNKPTEHDEDAAETSSADEAEHAEEQAAEEHDDAAAKRIADALGVGDGEEEAGAKAEGAEGEGSEDEAAPVQNRAARRAEAAQRRKKRKSATATGAAAEGDEALEDLPKDKNARAKELLKRRREQAATATARPVQLLPGEMVDDALARSASAVGKWLRANFSKLQWVIVAAIVGGGGYLLYASQTEKKSASASDTLLSGVHAEDGRVLAEDKRGDDEKEADPTKVFKTAQERSDNALASYRKVVAEYPGTGAAILARLGEAGTLLDDHQWDKALEAYSAVSSSTLAGADTDVKGRALEGLGYAKEGKGDLDGANAAFKEMEGLSGFKELGQYHEARLLLLKADKGDKDARDKAKDLLKQVHDALEKPTEGRTQGALKMVVDDTLRRIDPTLVPPKPVIGGGAQGGAMNQEELQRAIKKLQENMAKQQKEKHE